MDFECFELEQDSENSPSFTTLLSMPSLVGRGGAGRDQAPEDGLRAIGAGRVPRRSFFVSDDRAVFFGMVGQKMASGRGMPLARKPAKIRGEGQAATRTLLMRTGAGRQASRAGLAGPMALGADRMRTGAGGRLQKTIPAGATITP